ncbi:hypothetical protein [Paenibacillus sp. Leaf72]|uniref:hypothetical protein n=1 Tax=Paenibacillus sp. Leaf72 TaxID=1736234 RepID=UPI0006FE1127|nr:hypothetical protein [Paenibacillus sp. Leaf72]KQN96845.1 hypothetical protein ASF12_22505 [Paenibacillus sp. Leaf72]
MITKMKSKAIQLLTEDDIYTVNCLKVICENKYNLPQGVLIYSGIALDRGRLVFSTSRENGLLIRYTHYFITVTEIIKFLGMFRSVKRLMHDVPKSEKDLTR